MTRKYQRIMRSTTAFLEMKESDILNLGQDTSSWNKLPKHIIPPYPQSSTAKSSHIYPHICDLKVTEHQQVINRQVGSSQFVSLNDVCLLPQAKKETEKVSI